MVGGVCKADRRRKPAVDPDKDTDTAMNHGAIIAEQSIVIKN
jgi:hypothetical protein